MKAKTKTLTCDNCGKEFERRLSRIREDKKLKKKKIKFVTIDNLEKFSDSFCQKITTQIDELLYKEGAIKCKVK